MARRAAIVLSCTLGCSAPADDEAAPPTPPAATCPAATVTLAGGKCQPAGIPPAECAAGFQADDAGGCVAILPDSCPKGMLAVPGDKACHEVAPCGSGDYGDVPTDAATVFVNAAYAGGANDGSSAHPFTTLLAAVKAAPTGATIAIAAGTYTGQALIMNKRLTLWGRCPSMVDLRAQAGANLAAIAIGAGSDGTVVRAVGMSTGSRGLVVTGSVGVVVDRVWIHDTDYIGLTAVDQQGMAGVTLTDSLVESTGARGVYVAASEAHLERTVIRGTHPGPASTIVALHLQDNDKTGANGPITVSSCVLEDNQHTAVLAISPQITIERSVIRRTQSDATGVTGFAVQVDRALSGAKVALTMRDVIVERATTNAVVDHASDLTLERVVLRDTQARPKDKGQGLGLLASGDAAMGRAHATLRAVVIAGSRMAGMVLSTADATVEQTIVRDVASDDLGRNGDGIYAQDALVTLRNSLVERTVEAGVVLSGAAGTLDGAYLRDVAGHVGSGGDLKGDGLVVVTNDPKAPASAHVTRSRIERCHRGGITDFGGTLELGASRIGCNSIDLDGESNLGLAAIFRDLGGDACGCDGASPCKVLSSNLAPPAPLGQ